MDYTTLTKVKLAMGSDRTAADTELAATITAVSRSIDRYCTGATDSDNYFQLSVIAGEIMVGIVDARGHIILWPRKPKIVSVQSFSWRRGPRATWSDPLEAEDIEIGNNHLDIWTSLSGRARVTANVSYTGGLFSTAEAVAGDLSDAATVLAVRFFKEVKSGLGDSIGVAELGTLIYTKAWPVRVQQMLIPYRRVTPWT